MPKPMKQPKKNVLRFKPHNLNLFHRDFFKEWRDILDIMGQFEHILFVSNPPYIPSEDIKTLDSSVKDYEPKLALIAGPSGLEFYKRLSLELPGFLKSLAAGFFEIGKGQGEALLSLFSDTPWKNCNALKDWSSHDRFFFLEIE